MSKIIAGFAFKKNEIVVTFDRNTEIPDSLFFRIGSGEAVKIPIKAVLDEKKIKGRIGFDSEKYGAASYVTDSAIDGMNISLPFYLSCSENFDEKKSVIKLDIIDEIFPERKTADFPVYYPDKTVISLFSPLSQSVSLFYYENCDAESPKFKIPMDYDCTSGIWSVELIGNHHGMSYLFEIKNEYGSYLTIDPYSLALSHNSEKSVILDMKTTNPRNWDEDEYVKLKKYTDAILYETHIRDMTSSPHTNIMKKRKYGGFSEASRTDKDGNKVGLDHIADLGISHVHILPVQDFGSVDDSHPSDYNWGYDPFCYTVPEGSYSDNSHDPARRIKEFKSLVSDLHAVGLGVVMDVVYNHTYDTLESVFSKVIPYYFYRLNCDGTFSNGSGCGNEIATERKFVRRFIKDTLSYWQREYHVDGFRFDLMGLMDLRTMKIVTSELFEKNKSVLLYGEPWVGGNSALPEGKRALKNTQKKLRIAVFNDIFRNALKGYPDDSSSGYVSGGVENAKTILECMLGSIHFNEKLHSFCEHPTGTINYSCCHDNLTLRDKLVKCSGETDEGIFSMNKLTAFIVAFAFGIPFFMSGEEFMRSKYMESNTYNLGDIYNSLDWRLKSEYADLFGYYRGVIAMRRKYPQFRIDNSPEVRERVKLLEFDEKSFAYSIKGGVGENDILISVNNSACEKSILLPAGEWRIFVNSLYAGESVLGICGEKLEVSPKSWFMLVKSEVNI